MKYVRKQKFADKFTERFFIRIFKSVNFFERVWFDNAKK